MSVCLCMLFMYFHIFYPILMNFFLISRKITQTIQHHITNTHRYTLLGEKSIKLKVPTHFAKTKLKVARDKSFSRNVQFYSNQVQKMRTAEELKQYIWPLDFFLSFRLKMVKTPKKCYFCNLLKIHPSTAFACFYWFWCNFLQKKALLVRSLTSSQWSIKSSVHTWKT